MRAPLVRMALHAQFFPSGGSSHQQLWAAIGGVRQVAGEAVDFRQPHSRRHEDRMVRLRMPRSHWQRPYSAKQRAGDFHAPFEQRHGLTRPRARGVALQAQVVGGRSQHVRELSSLRVVADGA